MCVCSTRAELITFFGLDLQGSLCESALDMLAPDGMIGEWVQCFIYAHVYPARLLFHHSHLDSRHAATWYRGGAEDHLASLRSCGIDMNAHECDSEFYVGCRRPIGNTGSVGVAEHGRSRVSSGM